MRCSFSAAHCRPASGSRVRLHVFRLGRGGRPPPRGLLHLHVSRGRPESRSGSNGWSRCAAAPARLDACRACSRACCWPGAALRSESVTEEFAQGHYQERCRGFWAGILPNRSRAHLRRRRRPARQPRVRHWRKRLAPWTAGGATTLVLVPESWRPARQRSTSSTSPARHSRHLRSGFQEPLDAGLLRAPGHEHDPRGPVPVATERERAGGEGIQLRRQLQLRLREGSRPLPAGGDVVSDKTDAALVEFMKELKGIVGTRPVTDEELTTAKDALVQSLPAAFSSVASVNGAITSLWVRGCRRIATSGPRSPSAPSRKRTFSG